MMNTDSDKTSNWGGSRPGAGNKYKWRHGETKAVRIPISIADEVLEVAKAIDSGEFEPQPESVTQSSSNYQAEIEELKANLASVTKQLQQVTEELDRLKDDNVTQSSQDEAVTQSRLDLPAIRDRLLMTQPPNKRRELKKALDQFIASIKL
ncbi:hypothetical protein QT972_18340 [Microcoleus sp. herbarium7]|uniref:hypothetical protein n=1 Tax=Microcoleus sp. herbarium7 TaxID=3055435 RepID=UPI002FD2049B